MTWYAAEVLATCNPLLLEAVKSDPALAACSYLIRESINFELNGSEYSFRPPQDGLLVIRPVCDPKEHCADWHEEPVLSWHSLVGPDEIETISPRALGSHIDEGMLNEFPPASFFSYLKRLSATTNVRLAFFYCFMWGGDTEFEHLWLFGEREEAALVLEPGVRSKVVQVSAGGNVQHRDADLLTEALAYLGAPIPSSFWAPHTRGFPWEQYKLVLR